MRILVIRLKHIGDALLSLPVCRSLRKTLPDAGTDYLVYDHIAPLFRHDPAVDNVVTISAEDRHSPRRYLQKMMAIRRRRYDIVIDLLTVPVTAWITRLSGAGLRIGFDKGKWRSRLYNVRLPYPETGGSLNAKLVALQGLPFEVTVDRSFDVVLLDDEVQAMCRRMNDAGMDPDRPAILFSPVSRVSSKTWPDDYFVAMVEHCLENHDVQALMISGPGEEQVVKALARRVRYADRVFADVETADVRELAALARNCAIFVGNDSGPRHIAEAAGIPTFTIFTPTVLKRAWLPNPGPRHRGVDVLDALDIDEDTWRTELSCGGVDVAHWYRRITPELVIRRLAPMLDEVLAEETGARARP